MVPERKHVKCGNYGTHRGGQGVWGAGSLGALSTSWGGTTNVNVELGGNDE